MNDRRDNQQQTDAYTARGASKSSTQLLWGAVALLVAAALLLSFYNVTQAAVARAHTHWAQAVQQSGECRPGAENCAASSRPVTMDGMVVSHASR